MAAISPTIDAMPRAAAPAVKREQWWDLFRWDQTALVGGFFIVVAWLMLALILPYINVYDVLARTETVPVPATTEAWQWWDNDWAYNTATPTTLSTLTFGFDDPTPPQITETWRWWANDWAWRISNPIDDLAIHTVDFSLWMAVIFLGGGFFAVLAQDRLKKTNHVLIHTAVVAAIALVPAFFIAAQYGFLLPIVLLSLLILVPYLGTVLTGIADQFGIAASQNGWLIVCGALIIPAVMVLAAADKTTNMVTLLASSFRLATPIVIGAMAGIWCERSGVVNIAIEGMMLTGACYGFVAFTLLSDTFPGQQGLYISVMVASLSGGLMALLHAWLSITFKVDQIISGTVINILALGATSFTRREVLLEAGDSSRETLAASSIPVLGDIPVLGEILFTGKPVFFSMFVLVLLTHVMLFFTRWGLRTRAVGENPHAADTLGINVIRSRYTNVVIGGLIAGIGGAWFSLETAGSFDDNMTNGLGFIALAAVIFGKWRPIPALAGGLLFGFSRALDTRFQILEVSVPVQFVQMTPYLVTMVVLAGLVGRSVAPRALGIPYEKE